MKKVLLLLPTLLLMSATLSAQTSQSDYTATHPWVRWWWNGDKVDTLEIKRELHILHDAGIGGVEINPIEFPAKRCDDLGIASLELLSPQWLDALEVALREAKTLGMGCDLLVGSGWPFGRETLPMNQRAQVMLTYALPVEKDFRITKKEIYSAVDPQVTVPNPDRTFDIVSIKLTPDTVHSLSEAEEIAIPQGDTLVVPHSGVLYVLVHCTSFASVINGAPGAAGPILDHLNREAVQRYLDWFSSTLESRLGPMRRWLRAYFVDSMELEGSNWTTDFAAEFRHRRGYDLMPWLPFTMFKVGRLGEVAGYQYGAIQDSLFRQQVQQVRHDFELTKAELFDERYTQTFVDWCHRQGVKARAQAYGRGFFPLESSLRYDIPEGESWTTNYLRHRIGEEMGDEDYRRGRAYTMINKYVSSAAHIAGHPIVSAEEMTNTYRIFETTLELLKLGSDMSAISGTTHSVWHGFNYSPQQAGFPGWVQYGSYYNEQNTWWPYFHLLNEYRARMSAILQHAEMQADIAILLPVDEMWGELGVQTEPFPNYPKGSHYIIPQLLWEAIHKNGGNCDFVTPRIAQLQEDGSILAGKRHYDTYFTITRDHITLSRAGQPDVRLSLPEGNHYLEWYAGAQHQYSLPHVINIEKPWRYLLQNHYRNDVGQDVFLLVNASLDSAYQGDITFPGEIAKGRSAWVMDCNTGKQQWMKLKDGSLEHFYLGPCESMVIIFRKSSNRELKKAMPWQPAVTPSTNTFAPQLEWHVSLHHAIEGWTRDTVMTDLRDLRETPFKDFSGTITYTAQLHLDSGQLPLQYLYLDGLHDICQVSVNGVDLGTEWFGTRQYTVPKGLLRKGDNTLQITITTTLNNYVHTLTDDKVVQHFVLKRNVPTSPLGLLHPLRFD